MNWFVLWIMMAWFGFLGLFFVGVRHWCPTEEEKRKIKMWRQRFALLIFISIIGIAGTAP